MNNGDGLSRFELAIVLLVFFLAAYPMVEGGGILRFLSSALDSSAADPVVTASAWLAMFLIALVAIVRIWAKHK